ncbi:MAG: DNA cytosine methyltransferase, partial [Candidatus Hodarchaeota archaeon]
MKIPIISFFSGCGGFDFGFTSVGFSVNLALDVDSVAVNTYNHNIGMKICQVADLANLKGNELISLYEATSPKEPPKGVIGGAPCQTFSHSNVHFREDDNRHLLSRKYACLLRILNRKYNLDFFVFENVKGITSYKHRKEYSTIKRLFSTAGFRLFEGELDAQFFGVAQYRNRVFIVGINKEKYPKHTFYFPLPETKTALAVKDVIAELPEPYLYQRHTIKSEIPFHPNHWTMFPRSKKFYDGSLEAGSSKGRSFRVLNWNRPSWTVAYGNREVHVHPNGRRRLSVYEAMRLQGFSHSYEILGTLSDQIRQVS